MFLNISIQKLIKKDPKSVAMIINKYNKKIFSIAYRFTNNQHDAEDVVQEIWMKFFHSISKFKEHSSIYTYLYRIAINESLMHIRRNRIQKMVQPFTQKADNHTPENEYLKKEQEEFINRAVYKLPDKQKKVFCLRQNQLSFNEISNTLGIKENNAKTHYFYALQNIRKYLKELHYEKV